MCKGPEAEAGLVRQSWEELVDWAQWSVGHSWVFCWDGPEGMRPGLLQLLLGLCVFHQTFLIYCVALTRI